MLQTDDTLSRQRDRLTEQCQAMFPAGTKLLVRLQQNWTPVEVEVINHGATYCRVRRVGYEGRKRYYDFYPAVHPFERIA